MPRRTHAPLGTPTKPLANFRRFSYAPGRFARRSGTSVPKPSLPVRLALLVAGTTLPLIIFAAGIVFNNYEQDRKDATQRVLETVRSIRLVLDAEMQRMTGGASGSGADQFAARRDFDNFRRIALGFLDQYGKDGVVLVADREGRQLFSSVTPTPQACRRATIATIVDKVFADQEAAFTPTFSSARSRSG